MCSSQLSYLASNSRRNRTAVQKKIPTQAAYNTQTGPNYGAYRARTCDPLLVRQMLSQLS